jgi:transposase
MKLCPKCGVLNHHLYEWRGEQICYSCMKGMGLIGL